MPTPLSGFQNDVCVGTMFFSYKEFGWSEKYIIQNQSGDPVPDLFSASVLLAEGAAFRAFLLGAGCVLSYARVSLASALRDSLMAINAPILPGLVDDEEDTPEELNSVQVGALVRMDDLAGKFATRAFRGLRDSWVTDQALTALLFAQQIGSDTAYTTVTPPTLFTASAAVANWYRWMKKNTVFARKVDSGGFIWQTFAMPSITFRKISSRDTGRPFGTSRGRAPSFA